MEDCVRRMEEVRITDLGDIEEGEEEEEEDLEPHYTDMLEQDVPSSDSDLDAENYPPLLSLNSGETILVPEEERTFSPGLFEVMIPGNKVGLIIGKGGETIKMLREQTGARITIIIQVLGPSI